MDSIAVCEEYARRDAVAAEKGAVLTGDVLQRRSLGCYQHTSVTARDCRAVKPDRDIRIASNQVLAE